MSLKDPPIGYLGGVRRNGVIVPMNVCLPPATVRALRHRITLGETDREIVMALGIYTRSVEWYRANPSVGEGAFGR
jgi:hypothetical protein